MTPSVSILMPVYNCGVHLAQALDSILAQTYGDWELIAVNDGSTDESGQLLDAYAARDPRIRVIHQSNAGLPVTLNRAFFASAGSYIARMDGDDIAAPQRLERQLAFLNANPAIALVGSAVDLIDPKGRSLGRGRAPIEHEAIDAELMQGNGSAIYHPTIVLHRWALEWVGGYDETSGLEDLDLFLRLAEKTRLANLAAPLLQYRLHFGSTNANRRERHARMTDDVVCRAYARRGLDPSEAPRRRVLQDSPGAVYEDWSMKAAFSHHFSTAVIHAVNAFRVERGPERWHRFMRCMRLLVSLFSKRLLFRAN
jgi:glycosyltransferase involved in cell wall biosynthesis